MTEERSGTLYGVGVGPGDPELLTAKATRLLRSVGVVAYFAGPGKPGNARKSVASYLDPSKTEIRMEFPITTGDPDPGTTYDEALAEFYDRQAVTLGSYLDSGADVFVACEGDPFFYGSFM